MAGLRIMDTTIRDGQQSLWATRMTTAEMLPILPKMDEVGYWAIEAWGGATFDSCLRFLDEDPWERLRLIKERCPNTPLAMLVRGQNLVGYKHYSTSVVEKFIERAHANGIDVFRVFDALNDIDNIRDCAAAIKKVGAHFEPAISYTRSPVHTLDSYIRYARQLAELGADSICIKDMAGLLVPYRAAQLVSALRTEIGLPVHMHCHFIGGMASTNYLRGAEEGAEIVDCAHAPLAFGNSQPAVEMTVSSFQNSPFDTGLDLDLLFEIADYWDGVRKRGHHQRGITTLTHMRIYKHQIPGGMMSNLVGQLDLQNMHDRLPEVVAEIPRVRKEVGYPPLVTPMSQIVGTQAVMNVLTGKRWGIVSKEMRDYLMGAYGKTPAPISEEVREKVLGKVDVAKLQEEMKSAHLQSYDEAAAEIGDLAQSEEDVLSYALFPNEARALLEKRAAGTLHDITQDINTPAENADNNEEELEMNVDQIRELIEALDGSSVADVPTKEGDAAGYETLIVTGDRDLTQLASDHTTVAVTHKGVTDTEHYTPEHVEEKLGITPAQIIDMKALMGDTSDNYPGVTKVGEKTALKLVKRFGSVENLYDNIDELKKSKMKEHLIEDEAVAKQCKTLATILRDAPLAIGLRDLQYTGEQTAELVDFYQRMGFKSFLAKMDVAPEEDKTVAPVEFTELTADNLAMVDQLTGEVSFFLEMPDANYHTSPFAGFVVGDGQTWLRRRVCF